MKLLLAHRLIATVVELTVTAGCSGDAPQSLGCPGAAEELTLNGQEVALVEVTFNSVGTGGGVFADRAQIEIEGDVVIVLQFSEDTVAGETITIVPEPDATEGALVINYAGFEGGPQNLCATEGQNAATSGSFTIEALSRDDEGRLNGVCGRLELSFSGCDFPGLGVAGDVTFGGGFDMS